MIVVLITPLYIVATPSVVFPSSKPRLLFLGNGEKIMKRYVIERDLPGIANLDRAQLKDAAATSNAALAQLSGKAQWLQSSVVADKTFCIYLADSEGSVREHARLSGFPATKISEVSSVI